MNVQLLLLAASLLLPARALAQRPLPGGGSGSCDFNGDGTVDEVERRHCSGAGAGSGGPRRRGPQRSPDDSCDFNGDGVVGPIEQRRCQEGRGSQDAGTAPGFAALPAPTHLKELADKDITPQGVQAVRPNAAFSNGRFFVGYTQLSPKRAFGMLTLSGELKVLDAREVCPPEEGWSISDLRIARAGSDRLWCAFETARMDRRDLHAEEGNAIHWAFYGTSEGLPALELRSEKPAATRPGGRYPLPDGTEITDDPVPFPWKGRYHITSRVWHTPRMPVRVFDEEGTKTGQWDVDLKAALKGLHLTVYSLAAIEGKPWIVGSLQSGPPLDPSATSILAAIPLSADLRKTAGPALTLSKTDEFQSYVAGVRYRGGKLYVAHNVNCRDGSQQMQARLKVFDVKDGFKLLDEALIDSGRYPGDDHVTVELANDRVYVFYPTPQRTLRVKVFEYR